MKLLVKQFRFQGTIEDYLDSLFTIPVIQKLFDEGFENQGIAEPDGYICHPFPENPEIFLQTENLGEIVKMMRRGVPYQDKIEMYGFRFLNNRLNAQSMINSMPISSENCYLMLTTTMLIRKDKESCSRIQGRGVKRRVVMTNYNAKIEECMLPDDITFISVLMEELGHGLGIHTHHNNRRAHCVMQGNSLYHPDSGKIENLRYCKSCIAEMN